MRIKIKSMCQLLAEAPDNPLRSMFYQNFCSRETISKVAGQWHDTLGTLIVHMVSERQYNTYLIHFPGSTVADSRLSVPEWWIEEIEED